VHFFIQQQKTSCLGRSPLLPDQISCPYTSFLHLSFAIHVRSNWSSTLASLVLATKRNRFPNAALRCHRSLIACHTVFLDHQRNFNCRQCSWAAPKLIHMWSRRTIAPRRRQECNRWMRMGNLPYSYDTWFLELLASCRTLRTLARRGKLKQCRCKL